MASLNHVCMWSEHGWIRITADEASAKHPGGTVSAHSGLFMCELCGQYVTLTDGDIRDRYFRHSANEANKNCPERTFGASYTPSYNPGEHELPIKLIVVNDSIFRLELGLIGVPSDILYKQQAKSVTIKSSDGQQFVFSFERLNDETITYLPIGNEPSNEYSVISSPELAVFWPKKVKGISKAGSVFDADTGKMLPVDADVQVRKKYLLITNKYISDNYICRYGITVTQICVQRVNWITWHVYEIEASALNEAAAKFFLDLHCRLTDAPLEINPIWPIHIKTPYLIKHCSDEMILHLSGSRQITTKAFPFAAIMYRNCGNDSGRVIKISCKERQQLISAGSANVLQYLYLWKEPLVETTPKIEITVVDAKECAFECGEYNTLPERNILRFQAPYDGMILLSDVNSIIEKIKLPANQRTTVNNLHFGLEIQILQGLDTVWSCTFRKPKKSTNDSDNELYEKLCSFTGNNVRVNHRIGAIKTILKNYPRTVLWIHKAIQSGDAPANALKYLEKYVIQHSSQLKGE